jgi:branched-chain amino acid transport system substrate-binding protein
VLIKLIIISLVFSISLLVQAADEITKPIVLGSSSALSGPAKQLGTRLNAGANLFFEHLNETGGVNGRSVELVLLDDAYEPTKALKNTYQLLSDKSLFAFFNFVGTPTSSAVLPEVIRNNIPYITPFTGAQFLREESAKGVVNLRASYYQEAQEQIDYLVEEVKAKKIGLLVQADEFGTSLEKDYLKALTKIGRKPTVITRFRRNTTDIELALEILMHHEVDAVAFVGTYAPFATLISTGYLKGFSPYYTAVSFVSSKDLFPLLSYPSKVLITEVVPDIQSCKQSVCVEFRALAKKANLADYGPIEFEGFLNAKLFAALAQACIDDLKRSCIIQQLASASFDLGGIEASYVTKSSQGIEKVYRNFNFGFQ